MSGCRVGLLLACISLAAEQLAADEPLKPNEPTLTVPAMTAYVEPFTPQVRVTPDGIRDWRYPGPQLVWYGWLADTGMLALQVDIRGTDTSQVRYRLQVHPVGSEQPVRRLDGNAVSAPRPDDPAAETAPMVRVEFDSLEVQTPGYHRFELSATPVKDGQQELHELGTVLALRLTGPPARNAQFNQTARRNAASVHLWYAVPQSKTTEVEAFYNELKVETDPVWSYYMACGFHRGYFGIQVNSPTERRIIFSVWDSGGEPIDRNKVKAEDQVALLKKGPDVVAHGFGNEGTGGHSHLVYDWKTADTHRFLVTAQPDGKHTIFTGYYYFPEHQSWGLIASFRAPKDGGYLRGLYSFNENYVGVNGQLLRQARFQNQWIRTAGGEWIELTLARFTHDGHGREQRKDYNVVLRDGAFLLSNGGFLQQRSNYGTQLDRPSTKLPEVLRHAPPAPKPQRPGP